MATGSDTAKDTVKATIKEAEHATVKEAEHAKAITEEYTAKGAQAFKEGVEKSVAGLTEITTQSKQTLDALVASATAAAKGAETLSAQAVTYGKAAVEKHVEAAKALSGARSVHEVIELQTAYAKSSVEAYVAEVNRASETFSTVMKNAFRPLNERATAVVETFQSAR